VIRVAFAVLLWFLSPAWAVELRGVVTSVADGDTLTLQDSTGQRHRIRIGGIDAPERGQAFSQVARRSLEDLTLRRQTTADCSKTDRYERQVCKVTVGGVDVGLEQVRRGLAWHFKRYEVEQSLGDRRTYAVAEQDARAAKMGLWRQTDPVSPWVWREQLRQ
jgi:endonuclease YncB( thermonuclease family)